MDSGEIDRRVFVRQLASMAAVAGTAACSSGGGVTVVANPAPTPVVEPPAVTVVEPPPVPPAAGPPSAADITPSAGAEGMMVHARARGIAFGCGLNPRARLDPQLLLAHMRESGMVQPIAQGAWQQTHPGPDTWNFRVMDGLWEWAQSVNLPMRGTHLLWHSNMPAWFDQTVTPANAMGYLREHVEALLGRYKGLFHSWNPVNEAVNPPDGRSDGLRDSPWLRLLGPEYIAQAFIVAAEVDPSATLVYNEYGLEDDTPVADRRRSATLQLLTNLTQQGVPIHALGMQSHIAANTVLNATKLRAFLDSVAALGLKVQLTELDVKDQTLPADIGIRDFGVAAQYLRFLSIMLAHPAVNTVILWGLSDRATWLSAQAPRPDRLPVRVLPLDEQLRRKPAWTAIVKALNGQ